VKGQRPRDRREVHGPEGTVAGGKETQPGRAALRSHDLQREANGRQVSRRRGPCNRAQSLLRKSHKALTIRPTPIFFFFPTTLPAENPHNTHGELGRKKCWGGMDDPTLRRHAEEASEKWMVRRTRIFKNAKVRDPFAIVPTLAQKGMRRPQQKIFDMCPAVCRGVLPAAQSRSPARINTVASEKSDDCKIISIPAGGALWQTGLEGEGETDKAIVAISRPAKPPGPSTRVKECITKRPPRYTEATLLSAMEGAASWSMTGIARGDEQSAGLGTPGHAREGHRRPALRGAYSSDQWARPARHRQWGFAHPPC